MIRGVRIARLTPQLPPLDPGAAPLRPLLPQTLCLDASPQTVCLDLR